MWRTAFGASQSYRVSALTRRSKFTTQIQRLTFANSRMSTANVIMAAITM